MMDDYNGYKLYVTPSIKIIGKEFEDIRLISVEFIKVRGILIIEDETDSRSVMDYVELCNGLKSPLYTHCYTEKSIIELFIPTSKIEYLIPVHAKVIKSIGLPSYK